MSREATVDLLDSGAGFSHSGPEIPATLGDVLRLRADGTDLFFGYVVQRTRKCSGGATMTLSCLDRGWHLSQNEGWYSFKCTPEAAVRTVCADFGIPVGTLVSTGVTVARKFPGVPLHRILWTMYSKAAAVTGKRYRLYFDGQGRLCSAVKPSTAGAVLASKSNLSAVSISEDISAIHTSVAIYTEDGKLVRTVDDSGLRAAYGLFQHVMRQQDGVDALAEARAYLEDHGELQTVTVEALGNPKLVTGNAVSMRSAVGVSGLFWIDSDLHIWQKDLYAVKLGLNFRNLMAEDGAGEDV